MAVVVVVALDTETAKFSAFFYLLFVTLNTLYTYIIYLFPVLFSPRVASASGHHITGIRPNPYTRYFSHMHYWGTPAS